MYLSQFQCPICGSSHFGSARNPDGSYTRHCHGERCKFSWHESADEHYDLPRWIAKCIAKGLVQRAQDGERPHTEDEYQEAILEILGENNGS